MAHLELVALIVRDYDAAIRFFVDGLQFGLVEDVPSFTNDGRPKRWVAGRVGFFLHVDDFAATHARMVTAGVEFLTVPRVEPYGTVAVFLDLEGNRWDLLGNPVDN